MTHALSAGAGPDLHAVELARPGPWKVASGNGEFTPEMLRDAADFFVVSGGQAVPVKLGHTDDRFTGDGEPAFGSVTNVRYVEDERGPVLLGDITGMPGWLAASAPKRWPNRSIEGWQDFEYEGREYSLVLTALSFLGVTPPAVRNIRSLADLQTALAASSALRLVASAPADDPADPPAPAPEAEEPIVEGTGMDPVKIREALGLSADASDDEVKAAMLTAAGAAPQSAPPPEPAQTEPLDAEPEPLKRELVHAAGAPGTVVMASSVWEETQATIKKLTSFVDKTQRDERDQVIAKAVQDGKFTPAQRSHFSRLWDADPTGTRALIDNLTRNSALAVMASGYAGDDGEDFDKRVRAPVPAGREGGQPWLTTHRSTPAAAQPFTSPPRVRSPAATSHLVRVRRRHRFRRRLDRRVRRCGSRRGVRREGHRVADGTWSTSSSRPATSPPWPVSSPTRPAQVKTGHHRHRSRGGDPHRRRRDDSGGFARSSCASRAAGNPRGDRQCLVRSRRRRPPFRAIRWPSAGSWSTRRRPAPAAATSPTCGSCPTSC
jgi:hypothetical protein